MGGLRKVCKLLISRLARILANDTSHRPDIELTQHFQIHDRHIASLMLTLRADLEDGLPAGRLYGESLATALAVYLQRRYAVYVQKTAEYRGGMPKARLNRVLEYISANLSEDIRLSELARTAGMSPHYFSELFKQTTGLSPHQYVLRQKIERAKQHLRDPRANVIEASAMTGFVDQSYFTKVFRRLVGVTPTEFRNTVLGGNRRDDRVSDGSRFRVEVWPWVNERTVVTESVATLLENGNFKDASALLLTDARKQTESEFGFVGVELDDELLRLLAHEGFWWHETINREFYEKMMCSFRENGYLDFLETHNLVGRAIIHKELILTNSPTTDARSGGTPPGHPPLHSFLGMPAVKGIHVVGMIGLANRKGGYSTTERAKIEQLTPALVALYDCYMLQSHAA
jgi:AraC-like DNA-binding protein